MKKIGSVAGLAVIGLTLSLTMCSSNDDEAEEAAMAGDPANVPAEYLAAVKQAGSICPEVTPSIIAAQIAAESNWNPDARSPAGARGISQFMPSTWATHGVDGDGDGRADITNATDAIISQGYYMCELVDVVRPLASGGGSTGTQPAAVRAALAKVGQQSYRGRCEQFVRESFGFTGRYASANIAWQQAGDKHPGDANPPAGVPVFWDLTSGPNAAYDHIALSIGGGKVVSTSVGPGGAIGIISIAEYTAQPGVTYRGWAGIYHGQRVTLSVLGLDGQGIIGSADSDIVDLTLAAYNAGPGAVQRARGIPNNSETPNYVAKIKQLASTTYAPTAAPAGSGSSAPVEWVLQQSGKPYRSRGCKAPACYDCCTLVHDAYKQTLGIDLPMSTTGTPATRKCENAMLTRASDYGGVHVPATLESLQPGDLVFFQSKSVPASTDTVTHVAIYAGDGQVVDAIPGAGVGQRSLDYYAGSDDLLPQAVRIPQE